MAQSFRTRLSTGGASTDGQPIAIAATASPGTLLHQTPADATKIQEVFVELCNTQNAAKAVGVQWGGTAAANLQVVPLDPYESRTVSCQLSKATALDIRAYMVTGSASDVNAKVYALEETNT